MRNNFEIITGEESSYHVKIIFRYRTNLETRRRYTSCMMFFYNPITGLPKDLDLQTASVTGFAECSPKDQFSKDVGRKLCIRRAIANLPREERIQFWDNYHNFKYSSIEKKYSRSLLR